MDEMNKTVHEIKVEKEAIEKTQTEEIMEIQNLGKRTGTTEASITNRVQERKRSIGNTVEELHCYTGQGKC